MNKMNLRSCVTFVVILCGLLAAGYAATSTLQIKPANISAFFGTWQGNWTYENRSGGVTTEISPSWDVDKARVKVTVYGTFPTYDYSVTARFSEGELLYNGKNLQMVFRLYGENTLLVPYSHNGSPGEYQLTRSR